MGIRASSVSVWASVSWGECVLLPLCFASTPFLLRLFTWRTIEQPAAFVSRDLGKVVSYGGVC